MPILNDTSLVAKVPMPVSKSPEGPMKITVDVDQRIQAVICFLVVLMIYSHFEQ